MMRDVPRSEDHGPAAPDGTDSLPQGLYLDFEVEVGPGLGRSYPVAVIRSPAGEARGTMEFPYDELTLDNRLKDLEVALLRSGGARRQTLTSEEEGVRRFGQDMFDALLAGDARSRYDVSCREARRRGRGLRLKLRIRTPELARLPWEYLYDERVGEYVCLSRDTPVVRFLETAHSIEPLTVDPPLRILAMIVSPTDLTPLETDRERERVERALERLERMGLAELTWMRGETWRDLQRAMRSGPWHVFHFIGHGGFDTSVEEGVIALADEHGRAQRLLATEVGRLLADHHSLRLVLLNSCEGARSSHDDIFSSTAAVLVRRGLPAVLAMQREITDRAAIEFARAFYEALAEGLPVDAAVTEARKAVSLAVTNTVEWGTPVLYMRAPEGVIFTIPPAEGLPPVLPPGPRRDDAELEETYTEALSAFWVSDWATARERLQAIVDLQPDYADAEAKLAEAHRQLAWESLYDQASDASHAGELAQAIALFERLTADAPDYRDASSVLADLRKQARLDELLDQARRLSEAEQWRAVVAVFEEIHTLEPDIDDEGMLATAREGVAQIERLAQIEALYAKAVRSINAGAWKEGRDLLGEVQALDPEHRETSQLLAKCEEELAQLAEADRRAQEAASRYEQASALAHAGRWGDALTQLAALAEIDPDHEDAEAIEARARAALDAEAALAQQQKKAAAHYAEAVEALRDGRYDEALAKWETVRRLDPSFVDHRKVAATARQKLKAGEPRPRRRLLVAGAALAGGLATIAIAIALSGGDGEGPAPDEQTAPPDLASTSVTGPADVPDDAREAVGDAEGPAPDEQTAPPDLAGASVTVFADVRDDAWEALRATLHGLEEDRGMVIRHARVDRDDLSDLAALRARDDPPGIIAVALPGAVQEWAENGDLIALPESIATGVRNRSPSVLFDAVEYGDALYGVPDDLVVKSLVWYNTASFNGYRIPGNWEGLADLTARMNADGVTPWCVDIEPFIDWVEEAVLRRRPDVYDQWVAHDIPFNHPGILEAAYEVLGLLDGAIYAPGDSIASASGEHAEKLARGDCLMHHQGSFFASQFPDDTTVGPDGDVHAFFSPAVDTDGGPVLVGATYFVALRDAPEVWEVMEYLASDQYATARHQAQSRLTGVPAVYLSANVEQDLAYHDLERFLIAVVRSADDVRFDGSDRMPLEVGTGSFWTLGTEAGADTVSIEDAFATIEESWPAG